MLLMSTRPIRQVETTNICNQSAEFKLWWVGSKLKFSQPSSDRLDRKMGVYPPTSICTHPYFYIYIKRVSRQQQQQTFTKLGLFLSWATKYGFQPWHQNFLIMDTMPPIYFDFWVTMKYELYTAAGFVAFKFIFFPSL